MRILLSAYACDPKKGSEPGIGWHWVKELAKSGHDVWVLTRTYNKAAIEREVERNADLKNLRYISFDLSLFSSFAERSDPRIYLYYYLWQVGAYFTAKKYMKRIDFDLIHHITLGGVRVPSFLGLLGPPFVIGPLGGGERAPWNLRVGYGLRGFITDAVRDVCTAFIKFDPLMWLTFWKAKRIFTKTRQSKDAVPKVFAEKTSVQIEIGVDPEDIEISYDQRPDADVFKVLYVGRFLYWKGMHIGLEAFSRLCEKRPNARLTMVGAGPEESLWRRKAEELEIHNHINWISWLPKHELKNIYKSHDVFLFPSLHDSSGTVVLEAFTSGLPVVCLDLGGPGVLVNDLCGRVARTTGRRRDDVVAALADALLEIADDSRLHETLRAGAIERAKTYLWSNAVNQLYGNLEKHI